MDGRRARLPVIAEGVPQRRRVAVRDVEGGHQGPEADEDNLTPGKWERVIRLQRILGRLSSRVAKGAPRERKCTKNKRSQVCLGNLHCV